MLAKRFIWNRIQFWGCAIVFGWCLTGCTLSTSNAGAADPRPVQQEVEKAALEDGLLAFKEGDYRKAVDIFEALGMSARLPETGRKAVFGQASALLALARTPEEYAKAASVWEQWIREARSGLEGEDPRMLAPFVSKALQEGMNGSTSPVALRTAKDVFNSNCRNALITKEKEVEKLKVRLEAREREIRRLRHQLDSLEEIHRKYQEKKQGASP